MAIKTLKMRGKRYRQSVEHLPKAPVTVEQAISVLKKFKAAKFDESINIAIHLGIDPTLADQNVRGSVSLPKGIGKTRRVIAFVQGNDVEKAKAAGAIEAGADELIKKVNDGWLDFDVAIATPDMMPKITRLGKVLGPQGKMPSPKAGTVAADVAGAVKEYAAGKVEFRNDKGGNVHAVVGKLSFAEHDLAANIHAFLNTIRRLKPPTSKGQYVKKVTVHSSMSPGVPIDTSNLDAVEPA
ncbi:MAG: 50S ribosomal protein L1 [Planctomycetes bacterium]|jgi:large subunit ribosomal protein L1|nr:50S ribosomal protein L1 [Planctomycetota bacterium]MDA8377547.1 50S ribosomal protein L1 [Planctomycetia bacterium]